MITVHQRYRQTDGQTDRQVIMAIPRSATLRAVKMFIRNSDSSRQSLTDYSRSSAWPRKCQMSRHLGLSLQLRFAVAVAYLGRPEPPLRLSGRPRVYVLPQKFFFVSPRFLRGPSTDRPETLPHGWNLAEFYNPTPKIWGLSPKNLGPKTCKISVNFGPLQTLIGNISGTRQHIQNGKDVRTREIPPAFNEKSPVNFGPLTAWN